MEHDPGSSFRCGPYAVAALLRLSGKRPKDMSVIKKASSTSKGTSLFQLKTWAEQSGMKTQVAKRTAGAQIAVPSVMHRKLAHFGAITAFRQNRYRVQDPTFSKSSNLWMTPEAIDSESSGYFLVRAGNLPSGWQKVSDAEAKTIWGKGFMETRYEGKTESEPQTDMGDRGGGEGSCNTGMPTVNAFTMQAALAINDVPLSYNCPIFASPMEFRLHWNQNQEDEPSIFGFTNLGANWSLNWVSWVHVDGSNNALVHVRGGGVDHYPYTGSPSTPYDASILSQAQLTVPSTGVYQRLLPDGSIEVFDLADGTGNYMLTALIDPQGNEASVQYDSNLRVTAVLDPSSNASTFTYVSNTVGNSGFYKIAAITDAFSRSCSFSYDGTNTFLTGITDSVGNVSSFQYNTSTSFIDSMTTNYGTTSFETSTITSGYVHPARQLKFTFPDGTTSVLQNLLDHMYSYFWDREAMARYPNDPNNRIFTHCKTTQFMSEQNTTNEYPVMYWIKPALKAPVYFTYPDAFFEQFYGTINKPTQTTRDTALNKTWNFTVGGTINAGNVFSLNIFNSLIPGGSTVVQYTAQAGDTAQVVVSSLATAASSNAGLIDAGIYARSSGSRVSIVPTCTNLAATGITHSVSGSGSTFTGFYEGNSWFVGQLGGTLTNGDVLTAFIDAPTPFPDEEVTHTVQSGDTLESIAQDIAVKVNALQSVQSNDLSVSAIGSKIITRRLNSGTYYPSFFWNSGATETITDAGSDANEINSYEWNSQGKPTRTVAPYGREFSYSYASNGIDLEEIRETKDSDNFLLGKWTYNSQHEPLTQIDGSGQQTVNTYNVFGQLTSTTDALSNVTSYQYTSTATATVGGTVNSGNQVNLTVSDPALPGGSVTVSHTAGSGETKAQVAAALVTAINSNSDLQTLGVTASRTGAVITLKSTSVNATSYSRTVTGTITLALSNVAYGFLTKITGPLQQNDITTLSWNPNGTLASSTDSEGYSLAFQYDAMDRLTQTTHPDGTSDQIKYQDLDAIFFIDRLGRTTQRSFDAMDQLAFEIDPLGRKTKYTWCSCGSPSTLTDPANNVTTWNHDLEGRIIKKVLADSTTTSYLWEDNTGWLRSRTDALGQVTRYNNLLDGSLGSVMYPNANNPTSPVTYFLAPNFRRLQAAHNAWGQYNYAYNDYITDPLAPPITGGGRISQITNSVIPNSAVTYSYDALARMTNRSINGSSNSITWSYDAMSRVTQEVNALGTFGFTYVDDVSPNSKGVSRLASISYPNGQQTKFSWFDNTRDQRLREITNLDPSSQTLSQFDYSYDSAGQITRWLQQQKGSHQNFALDYDLAGQLTGAAAGRGSTAPPFANQNFYSYDAAANRTSAQQSQVQNLVVAGTKTTGDVLTVTVIDSALSGGQLAVPYTVASGDTLTTIARKLAATITSKAALQTIGVDAVASGTTITLRSKSPNITIYTTSLSGGATETITAGINSATHNITIGGTAHDGDQLQVIVRDPALSGGQTTVNYTVPTGASLNTIASGLASAINAGSGLAALGITATSKQRVITVKTLSPNVTNFTGSVSGAGATVTMSLGVSLNGSVTALISGTATGNDILTISVFDAGLSGGQHDISYTVLPSDTLATITSALAAAINADSQLRLIGVKASASSTKLTVTSVSTNDTTYLPSKSAGATETILWGLPANGTITASVAGSITAGDVVTINVFDAGLSGGSTSVSHTVAAGDTRKIIAASLASQINGNAGLAAIGVTALAVTPAGSVNVVNITSASSNATTYAKSTSPGATLSLTLSKSVGVTKATFNNVNELTSLSAGGATRFQGTTDRPVLPVTIDGNAAEMTTSQSFNGTAVLDVNPDSVPVSATAGGGSGTTTNDYKLDHVGATATLTFDANGNMTSDGTNSFSWDAENRLIQITFPGTGNNSSFLYDALGDRVRIIETRNSSVLTTQQFIFCGLTACEERDISGSLTKEFFSFGQTVGGTTSKYFYWFTHRGDVCTVTDSGGDNVSEIAYDPYGRVRLMSGSFTPDFAFASMYFHAPSGLNLTKFRAFSPGLCSWISRDPLNNESFPYAYCQNEPTGRIDPSGLFHFDPKVCCQVRDKLKELASQSRENNREMGIPFNIDSEGNVTFGLPETGKTPEGPINGQAGFSNVGMTHVIGGMGGTYDILGQKVTIPNELGAPFGANSGFSAKKGDFKPKPFIPWTINGTGDIFLIENGHTYHMTPDCKKCWDLGTPTEPIFDGVKPCP